MSSALRQCRNRLQLSQREFADRLGVAAETYRTWESGRRPAPVDVVTRARLFSGCQDDRALLPLRVLASMVGVHVATLRAAARDGRLPVVYDTRTSYRRTGFCVACPVTALSAVRAPPIAFKLGTSQTAVPLIDAWSRVMTYLNRKANGFVS